MAKIVKKFESIAIDKTKRNKNRSRDVEATEALTYCIAPTYDRLKTLSLSYACTTDTHFKHSQRKQNERLATRKYHSYTFNNNNSQLQITSTNELIVEQLKMTRRAIQLT